MMICIQHIEYELLCKRILERYTPSSTVLAAYYSPGGFGNVMHTVTAVSAAAIVGNYHFYIGCKYSSLNNIKMLMFLFIVSLMDATKTVLSVLRVILFL